MEGVDVIVIFMGHWSYFDVKTGWLKEAYGKGKPVIADRKNVFDPGKFLKEGFAYKGIGSDNITKNWGIEGVR